jgi:hypothetical protein
MLLGDYSGMMEKHELVARFNEVRGLPSSEGTDVKAAVPKLQVGCPTEMVCPVPRCQPLPWSHSAPYRLQEVEELPAMVPSLQVGLDSDEESYGDTAPLYPTVSNSVVGVAGGMRVVRAGVVGRAPTMPPRSPETRVEGDETKIDQSPNAPVRATIQHFEKLVAL